ncbi:hypothetical protein [Streptomyces qinglanensis]|uniref:hypothetical protein n=1 Tax=Streptomyces qinglanensis TaxID=943816 RepID=UPI003D744A15
MRDLASLSAAYTTASLTGLRPHGVLAQDARLLVEGPGGSFTPWPYTGRCAHHQDDGRSGHREGNRSGGGSSDRGGPSTADVGG